ncbi:MAG: hypothetical protein JW827_10265 [Spirochaetes bacterium]|nr:hypothetical protein [Spirochaetota bacterium]
MELLQKTHLLFYRGEYNSAVDEVRELVEEAGTKDKLLYLMEAGIILHTMGDYKRSNAAFEEADQFADQIKTSASKQVLAFVTSDRAANFTGENYERILIKFYMALNYIMMKDYEAAKRSFRKMAYDLKIMKYEDDKYKQNAAARFLDAVISENLGNLNDARVEYKNINKIDPRNPYIMPSRYILAVKEKDTGDMNKYLAGKKRVLAFTKDLKPADYSDNMGELVIIHEAGKAPLKQSRGRLFNDQFFIVALRAAIEVAIVAKGGVVSTASVMAMMTTAENPIPIYVERDKEAAGAIEVLLNNQSTGKTYIMNNYEETALRNFNDHYQTLVTRNVASIATKVVLAAIAADKLSDKAEKAAGGGFFASKLSRILIGAGTGKAVAETVKPDLRCWSLLPANFQITRIFLEPGEYELSFRYNTGNVLVSDYPKKITIKAGGLTFVNFRSMSRK